MTDRKESMLNYHVVFVLNGKRKDQSYEATSVGNAFAKCLKSHPDCELISAHLYNRAMGSEMWMNYPAPSTTKVEPLPSENRVQDEMELNDPRKVR